MILIVSLILILIGLYQLLETRNIIKMLVGLNILEIGVNIFIIAIGFVKGGVAPILTSEVFNNLRTFVDPLPQALVLTSIVIGLGVTALGLAYAKKIYEMYGTYDLNEIGGDSHV